MAIGPVPPLAGNSTSPLFDALGAAAGFGLVFASCLTSTNTGFGAEYTHGTHAAAIYDSQFKGAMFPAVKGNAPNSAVHAVSGAPQAFDFTLQASLFAPIENESNAISAEYSFGLHQTALYNSQIQSQVWGAVAKPPSSANVTSFPLLFAQPQELTRDLTLQGWVKIPSVPQGWLLTVVSAGPQIADFTVQASFQRSSIKNILASWNPTTIIAASQQDPTQIAPRLIKPPAAASPKPIIAQFVAQSPDPTQLQPQIFPAPFIRVVKYNLPPQFVSPPQVYVDIPQPTLIAPIVGRLPIIIPLSGAGFSFSAGTATNATIQLSGVYDYFTLIQAVIDFSHRSDIAGYMDYYVQQAETRIYRDMFAQNMGNGVKWLEQPISATIANGVAPIPAGYFALKTMQITSGVGLLQTLLYKDPQWIYANYSVRQPSGVPAYVARDGTNFIFGPYPDSAYALSGTYYGQTTPISASNALTWMTTYCPDLLLASCMLELQPFLKDSAALQTWTDLYTEKMAALVNLDQSERFAPGVLAMEIE